MTARTATLIIVALVTLGLIAWDIYVVFFNKEKRDSISEWMRDLGNETLIIPLGFGVLMGHWFWPNATGALLGQPLSAIVLGGVGLIWGLAQIFSHRLYAFKYKQICSVLAGIAGGHFLWPL